jgi:hypothetical protein
MTRTNFWIDLAIFLFFLVGFEPAFTGNAFHEWLNLAFAGTLIVHLLLHWEWMAKMLRHKGCVMYRDSRLNFLIDLLLFVVFVMMVLSGLMISRYILASPGDVAPRHSVWRELHSLFSNLLLLLAGLHIALHWQWIAHAWRHCLIAPWKAGSSFNRTTPASGNPGLSGTGIG